MPIARNDAGEVLMLSPDGQWVPPKRAVNPETGERLLYDGKDWIKEPGVDRSTGEKVQRALVQPAAGFNESLATTIGGIPDLIGSGMRAGMGAMGIPEQYAPQSGYFTDLARKGIGAVTTLGGALPEAPKPETTLERALYGGGKGVGDAAAVLLPATALAGGTSLAGRVAAQLAAQPGAQLAAGAAGGAVGEATNSPLAGMAAALATPALMSTAARAVLPARINLPAETQRLLGVADAEGIPLTAGQRTGSKPLQLVESAFDQLPFTSSAQNALREEQRAAFNAASLARSGTEGTVATPEVLNAAKSRIGTVIGDIADRNALAVTHNVRTDLTQMRDDARRFLTADVAHPVVNRINQVLDHADGSSIPGSFYRQLDSELGRTIRGTTNGDLRDAMGGLRERLRTAMDDSISAGDRDAWQEARRQYANLMVTAKAAGGAGEAAAAGNVSPLGLRGAVDQSTGRGYAFGQGDQNDLARVGQAFLRPTPDSGTAGRSFMMNMLTGGAGGVGGALASGANLLATGGSAATALALPKLVQKAYNSRVMQNYLINGIPGAAGLAHQAPELNLALAAALIGERARDVAPSLTGTNR